MLDTSKKIISLDELIINNEEIKKYITSLGIGVTYTISRDEDTITIIGSNGDQSSINLKTGKAKTLSDTFYN